MASNHPRNIGPMQSCARCGARTRAGTSCQAPAIAGAKRCRMHGGRGSGAPKGNQNARTHGLYDQAMQERRKRFRALRAQVRAALRLL